MALAASSQTELGYTRVIACVTALVPTIRRRPPLANEGEKKPTN